MAEPRKSRQVGLARALSKLGYCSRSDAFALIRAGRVQLNGRVLRNPETPVRLETDRITVNSQAITSVAKIYLMMNKPRGIVTTASDEKNRETVYGLLGKELPWVAPVGRLDKASEGLLLFTNDSEWGANVIAPETHLDKTYHVQIATVATEDLLQSLRAGVVIDSRERLRVKSAHVLRGGGKNSWLEIVLDEGKNRHIRKLMEQLGIEVLRLVRVAIGPLVLGNLAKGQIRPLTNDEKQRMDAAMQQSLKRIDQPKKVAKPDA